MYGESRIGKQCAVNTVRRSIGSVKRVSLVVGHHFVGFEDAQRHHNSFKES